MSVSAFGAMPPMPDASPSSSPFHSSGGVPVFVVVRGRGGVSAEVGVVVIVIVHKRKKSHLTEQKR